MKGEGGEGFALPSVQFQTGKGSEQQGMDGEGCESLRYRLPVTPNLGWGLTRKRAGEIVGMG